MRAKRGEGWQNTRVRDVGSLRAANVVEEGYDESGGGRNASVDSVTTRTGASSGVEAMRLQEQKE